MQDFFARSTDIVARELLGKFLVRKKGSVVLRCMITETEAYDGPYDLASHARFGPTERNKPMFGEPGILYVYLCYGIHWMLNVVTRENGYPAAVLIRGVKEAQGPGRLTKYCHIDGSFTGKTASPDANLWFENGGVVLPSTFVKAGPRIGVEYAGTWAEKPLRYYLDDDE